LIFIFDEFTKKYQLTIDGDDHENICVSQSPTKRDCVMDVSQYASALTNKPCYKLSRHQKEAVGLLQIGTFLEYFDLMLYVHMAVVLNGLFFPAMDTKTEAVMGALTFSSVYLLRPVGALIFGYIGDMIGRKVTVVLTTMMMAITCIILATLPTYSEIGITATYVFFMCRILQGMSSMGEVVGSQIYAVELIQEPRRHLAVSLINWCTMVGGLAALLITTYVINVAGNWRTAFWVGSCVAVVGSVARVRLRETPDFCNHLKDLRLKIRESQKNKLKFLYSECWRELKKKKTLAYTSIMQPYPVSFYVAYIYFNIYLKKTFDLSPEYLVTHNLKTSIASVVFNLAICWLVTKHLPLKIYKVKIYVFIAALILTMFALNNNPSYMEISLIQIAFITIGLDTMPTNGIFMQNFAISQRFSVVSITWAASRLTAHLIFISSLVYLNEIIGFNALLVVFTPLIAMALWGLRYFERLEKQKRNEYEFFSKA
jgi:MFS transporter, MHS family, proline/betaine transporter